MTKFPVGKFWSNFDKKCRQDSRQNSTHYIFFGLMPRRLPCRSVSKVRINRVTPEFYLVNTLGLCTENKHKCYLKESDIIYNKIYLDKIKKILDSKTVP